MGTVSKLKKRPPTPNEMAAYRMISKNWSEAMKRLILPRFWRAERK